MEVVVLGAIAHDDVVRARIDLRDRCPVRVLESDRNSGPTVPISCGLAADAAGRARQLPQRRETEDPEGASLSLYGGQRERIALTRATQRRNARQARRRSSRGSQPHRRRRASARATGSGRERDRLLPLSHLLAAIDVEDAQLAELGPAASRARQQSVPGGNRLVDDEREVLLHRGIGDHVLVGNERRHIGEELVEVELEVAPAAGQLRLHSPKVVRARRATEAAAPSTTSGTRERANSASTAPFAWKKPPSDDPGDAPALLGQLARRSAGRRARSRRARSLVAGVGCAGRLDEARQERRAEHRLLGRVAAPAGASAAGSSAGRGSTCTPRRAGADQDVLDTAGAGAAPSSAAPTCRARAAASYGTPSSRKRSDLLDEVDLAGDVARAPGRHASPASPSTSKPSRVEIARCSSSGDLDDRSLARALGPQRDDRTLRAAAVDVGVAGPARARASSTSSSLA